MRNKQCYCLAPLRSGYTSCFKLVCLLMVSCIPGAAGQTNVPTKVTISELLSDKQKWKSKRVEVLGFYRSAAEVSALYSTDEEAQHPDLNCKKGLWVDYRDSPNVTLINKGYVRIVGTFEYYSYRGCGHFARWPAEIGRLESLELTPTPGTNSVPTKRPEAKQ